jgi:very-short-patch-repair endonuclease
MKNNILVNKKGHCIKEIFLKKDNTSLYNKIVKFNLTFGNIIWTCKVYNYINNILELPKCYSCNNSVKFISFKFGYRKYCSSKCATNSPEFKAKKEETMIKNYDVKNPSQSKTIQAKKEKTLLKNYGVIHPFKSEIIKERAVQTNIKHWGVKNVSQSDIVNERKKETMLKNYNVEYSFQSEEIKNKITATIQNKYNVDHYVESKDNRICIKNSMDIKRKEFWSDYLKINTSDIIISGNTIIIKNLCKIHNSFEINRYNLYNRTIVGAFENICTLCNPISESSSIKENEVGDFIVNELNIKNVIKKDKTILKGKEIDIYCLDNKLGIEFDGLYWHSDNKKDENYHLNKTNKCEKQGIQLLHIFEDEWLHKKEIVKSIIRSKLNLINNKIYGDECQIREINSKTCKEFLEINHIQGNINSKIKIGLFYNDELVSVMTFNKKRSIEGEYEILRFSNKINKVVIDGASKLLNYFIKEHQPKKLTTLVDRRYDQGDLYKELGFEFINNSKTNYFYFKPSEMIKYYRFKFRKDVLIKQGFDESKTEFQIMAERGYLRIYDCGHMKFEKVLAL